MASDILQVKNLSVCFRDKDTLKAAVRKISFSVKQASTTVLVGESGCGKSVTALSVLRLLPPSASHEGACEVNYRGENLLHASPNYLRYLRGNRVSMVFQEPMTSLNPLHKIGRQIEETIMLHQGVSSSKACQQSKDLLLQVGIKEAAQKMFSYPHQLSGGQRQRVMIAMALANKPDLLIADEPTTALDVTVQAQILDLLQQLKTRHKMAVLLITHDLGVARKMADHVCVMWQGRLVEQGSVATVLHRPRHAYTKRLLACENMGTPVRAPKETKTLLQVDALRVWYPIRAGFFRKTQGHVRAVDGISLCVKRGQTVGIVGESGCGKTTLGFALLRLIKSRGKIVFLGKDISRLTSGDMRPLRRDMQIVFQDPYGSLNPRMTVEKIIGEGFDVHGMLQDSRQKHHAICQALREVGMEEDVLNRYPHTFSGGQRQRIALARALVVRPSLLVLDEPTSALDMSVQTQIINLLRQLQKSLKLSYVFVSHDLKAVRALAHYLIVMRQGKVVEQGTAEEVFSNPKSSYARHLMAAAFDMSAAGTGSLPERP